VAAPVYKVEIAFGIAPLADPTGSWVDVTSFVRNVAIRRGRNHELGRTTAGVATITLDNLDRRFDPTNGSSPYSPNVKPMAHVRVTATYLAVTYDVFRGFVEDFGQQWAGPAANTKGDAFVPLQAVDAFKVLSLLSATTPAMLAEADKAIGYWGFDSQNASGELLVTVPGNPTALLNEAPASGTSYLKAVAGPVLGGSFGGGGFTNSAQPFYRTSGPVFPGDDLGEEWQLDLGDLSIEAWVKVDAAASPSAVVATVLNVSNQSAQLTVTAPPAKIALRVGSPSAGQPVSTGTVGTGAWHHVAATRIGSTFRYYIDGALDSTKAAVISPGGIAPFNVELSTGAQAGNAIAHLAFYDYALTDAQVAAHAGADCGRFPPQLSGTAIDAYLTAVGWPAGLRSIQTGASRVAFTPDGSALDVLQSIAEDTEHGIFVVAGDGKVTFLGRDTLENSNTAVATFGDGAGEVVYQDLDLSYDDQDLWTEVTVSGPNGPAFTTSDATAVTAYGRRTLDVSGVAADFTEMASQGQGLLNRYKAPAVRPVALTLHSDRATLHQLQRVIGERTTVKRRPPGGGTLSVDAFIEGIDNDVPVDGWPVTTLRLGAPEPATSWILGDATYGLLGTTTLLGW
jgi:Concanavalin A-like lectin/glucanases superfamily